MTLRQYFAIIILFILGIYACDNPHELPLQNFYYPITTFQDSTVYIYLEDKTSDTKYDVFHYDETSSRLSQVSHAGDGAITQEQQFQVYDDGVVLDYMVLYDTSFVYNEKLQNYVKEVSVESGQVFYYEKMDSSQKLNYHISWKGEKPEPYRLDYIKYRYCNCEALDESSDTLVLKLEGAIEDTRVGTLSLDYSGYEQYQRGKGLVAYEHAYSNGLTLTYRLYEVLSLSEARKKYPELDQ